MKHYGDITKLNGAKVEPVNVVIGGSPCQDLSVAGKQAGLAGERSGLFMEQIRIIKEMRAEDERNGRTGENIRPRFMVWENVPGALSSNRGADFGTVLRETVSIAVPEAPAVPVPQQGWPKAGCLSGMGDGGVPFSIAWRILDAQYFGVPQRRRRISLIADFGGFSAPEILFERTGDRRHPAEGGQEGEDPSGDPEDGIAGTETTMAEHESVYSVNENRPIPAEPVPAEPVYCIQGNSIDRADTAGCNGKGWAEDISYTLNTVDRPAVAYSIEDVYHDIDR